MSLIKSTITTRVIGKEKVEKILENIKGLRNSYVTIGVHEGAGSYQGGETVAEVALWNEFGTRTVPERSWMRSAIDENEGLIEQWREEMVKHILEDGWTVEKALEAMGFRIQTLLQNKILSNVPPPYGTGVRTLGPLSKDEQGGQDSKVDKNRKAKQAEGYNPNQTLYASGLMYRSVTFKVVLK